MRTRCLVFLLFVDAEGMLLYGVPHNLSHVSRLDTTASPDETVSDHYDAAEDKHKRDQDDEERVGESLLQLMRWTTERVASLMERPLPATVNHPFTTNPTPEDFDRRFRHFHLDTSDALKNHDKILTSMLELIGVKNSVRLLYWLRKSMGLYYRADMLQQRLLGRVPGIAHDTLYQLWLEDEMTPEVLFNIVDTWDNGRNLWLEYTELYRMKNGVDAYPVKRMLAFLNKAYETDPMWLYGGYFQLMREMNLNPLAESMEKLRFRQLIDEKVTPFMLSRRLKLHKINKLEKDRGLPKTEDDNYWDVEITDLPVNDSTFCALKAYTLQYAAAKGEEVRMRAEEAFVMNDRVALRNFLKTLK